jgi:hypothetical protein
VGVTTLLVVFCVVGGVVDAGSSLVSVLEVVEAIDGVLILVVLSWLFDEVTGGSELVL